MKRDMQIGFLIGGIIALGFSLLFACLELNQSRANERTLSSKVDVLIGINTSWGQLFKSGGTNWGFIANTNHLPVEKASVPPQTGFADRIGTIVTNTAEAYFHAGINSAIEAHLLYVKGRSEQGVPVDLRGMPPKEWRLAAKGCWVLSYGKDGFIK